MMQIYKTLIFAIIFILVSAQSRADTKMWQEFLLKEGVDRIIIEKFEKQPEVRECFRASNILICLNKSKYNRISDNRIAKQAISKAAGLKVRNQVYNYALNYIQNYPVKNREIAINTYNKNVQRNAGTYIVKNINTKIEFIGDICYALAYVPFSAVIENITKNLRSNDFIQDYSKELLTESHGYYDKKQYSQAKTLLDEFIHLTPNTLEAYLLAMEIAKAMNDKSQIVKYADIILDKYVKQMSSNTLEIIGDLLTQIDEYNLAEKAYSFSLKKITDSQ